MANEKPLYTLYKALKANNYDVPETYYSFERTLTSGGQGGSKHASESRHILYNALKAQNFDVPDTYESFYSTLFEPINATTSRAKGGYASGGQGAASVHVGQSGAPTRAAASPVLPKPLPSGFGRLSIPSTPMPYVYVDEARRERAKHPYSGAVGILYEAQQGDTQAQKALSDAVRPAMQQRKDALDYAQATGGKMLRNPVEIGMTLDHEGNVVGAPMYAPTVARDEKGDMILGDDGKPLVGMTSEQAARNTYKSGMEDAVEADINRHLEDAYRTRDELDEQLKNRREELEKKPWWGKALEDMGKAAHSDLDPMATADDPEHQGFENDEEYMQLMSAARKNHQMIQALEDKRDRKMDNFWHALGTTAMNGYTFADGLPEMRDATALEYAKKHIKAINEKRQKGLPLTREEQVAEAVLQANYANDAVQSKYGDDYGKWSRAGAMMANSIDYMKDFLLMPGAEATAKAIAGKIASVAGKVLVKEAGESALKAVPKAIARATLKATGVLVGAHTAGAVISNTTGMGRTAALMAQKASGNVTKDEKGNYKIENEEGLMHALASAEREQMRENGSEMFGEFIPGGKYLGKLATKGLEKIGLSKVANFLTGMGNKQWYKEYSSFLKTGGYNGIPGEALEEYEGELFDALTGHADDAWKDFTSAKQNVDIWLGCGTMAALMGTIPMGMHMRGYYSSKHAMNNADKVASFRLTADKWQPLKDQIDNTDNGHMAEFITNNVLFNDDMHPVEKQAVLNYVRNLTKYRGFNIAQVSNAGDQSEEEQKANEAYSEGYNAPDEQKNDIKNQYEYNQERMRKQLGLGENDDIDAAIGDVQPTDYVRTMRDNGASEQDIQTALDYFNAKSAYEGMMDGVRDGMDSRIQESNNAVDGRTNSADGMIHPATLKAKDDKGNDKQAYIVSGNVVMTDDGTMVDREKSDNFIIIRNPETGKLEHAAPEDFLSIDEPIDAQQEKDNAAETIRQQYSQEQADKIDGVLPFNLGDQYTILGEDGLQHSVQVMGPTIDPQTQQTVPGSMHVLYDGQETDMPNDAVQQGYEAYNVNRLAQDEQEKAAEQAKEQQVEQPETPAEPQPNVYGLNDEVTLQDENGQPVRGSITAEENEDGMVEVYTEKPINGKKVNLFSKDELDGMLLQHNGSEPVQQEEAPTDTENQPENKEDNAEGEQQAPEAQEQSAPEAAAPVEGAEEAQEQPAETALSRIPTTEVDDGKGNMRSVHQWEQATPEDTFDALTEVYQGDEERTKKKLANRIKKIDSQLKQIQKQQDKLDESDDFDADIENVDTFAQLAQQQQALQQQKKYWQSVQSVPVKRKSEVDRKTEEERKQARAEREAAEAAAAEQARIDREKVNGVPDMVNDTPANARARGYRNVNGHAVKRQEKIDGVQGREANVKFSSKDKVKGRVAVIEADQLQPSHVSGQRNPAFFIDEAQPKNRTDVVSSMAAAKIAADMNPEEITGDGSAYQFSAPSVNARGEVIQGNNRSDALKLMWSSPAYTLAQQAYKQYLIDHAEEYGLDPKAIEQMKNPVMVNQLDVDDDEAIRLGQKSAKDNESGGVERIDPVTTSRTLGSKVGNFASVLLSSQDEDASISELIAENGNKAVMWLNQQGAISGTQVQSAIDNKGNLTPEARMDLQNILKQSLFEGAISDLPTMFDAMPAKAQKAILSTFMRDFDSTEDNRILPEIQRAIEVWYEAAHTASDFATASNYEAAKRGMFGYTHQYQNVNGESVLPSENYSNFAMELACRLQGCSMRETQQGLNDFFDLVQGKSQGDLFGGTTKGEQADRQESIRRIFNIEYKPISNNNGKTGSNAVADNGSQSGEGRPGSTGDGAGRERAESGSGSADGAGGTERHDEEGIDKGAAAMQQHTEPSEDSSHSIGATSSSEKIETERQGVNTEPSEKQKEAGNYKKGHVKVDGYDITIENPKGSTRSGKDASGKAWSVPMHYDYGYIKGTEGVDGDHIDVYLSDEPTSGNVYVVDQIDQKTGKFDEHKVMYGFPSMEAAVEAYKSQYTDGWKVGKVTEVSREDFKKWVKSSKRKTKPFSEYSLVKKETVGNSFDDFVRDSGGEVIPNGVTRSNVINFAERVLEKYPSHTESDGTYNAKRTDVEIPANKLFKSESELFTAKNGNVIAVNDTQAKARYELVAHKDAQGHLKSVSVIKYHEPKVEPKKNEGQFGLVNDARMEELKKRLRAKLNNLNMGVDPEVLAIGLELTAGYIDRGVKKFADYSKAMINDLGDVVRPYLKAFYNGVRDMPEITSNGLDAEMDDYETVSKFNVATIGKEGEEAKPSILDTAEQVSNESHVERQAEKQMEMHQVDVMGLMADLSRGRTTSLNEHFTDNDADADTKAAHDNMMKQLDGIYKKDGRQRVEGIINTRDHVIDFYKGKLDKGETSGEGYGVHYHVDYARSLARAIGEREAAQEFIDNGFKVGAAAEQRPTEPSEDSSNSNNSGNSNNSDDSLVEAAKPVEVKKPTEKKPTSTKAKPKTNEPSLFDMFDQWVDEEVNKPEDQEEEKSENNSEKEPETQENNVSSQSEEKPVTEVTNTDTIGDSEQYQQRKHEEDAFVHRIEDEIEHGPYTMDEPMRMSDVKRIVKDYPTLADLSDTDLQEMVELAMSNITRRVATQTIGKSAEEQRKAYDKIIGLYNVQPQLNARDSTRIELQQYSTPTPFAYLMGLFTSANHDVKSVFDPTAGNGALTICYDPKICEVNEIDDRRLENLRHQNFGKVTSQDGLQPFAPKQVDAVLTNPPFGTAPMRSFDDGTYEITSLEGQIVINALDHMKDDGRAAIIIGGNNSYRDNGSLNPKDAQFLGYLYTHYNVVDVINVDGKLYGRNGTKYPVRMILIKGRRNAYKDGELQRIYPPVQKNARAEQVTTFDELYNRIQDDILSAKQLRLEPVDDVQGQSGLADNPRQPVQHSDSDSGTGQRPVGASNTTRPNRPTAPGKSGGSAGNGVANVEPRPAGGAKPSTPAAERPVNGTTSPASSSSSVHRNESNGSSQPVGGRTDRPDSNAGRPAGSRERLKPVALTAEKVHYPNQSQSMTLNSMVPANQAEAIADNLDKLGDVDQFLVDELGYSSKEELYSHLAAEQIDSVALAIHQMKNGKAFIIGDMTGIGKGRQGAALIRWAVKQGKTPIYMTQKATLFSDNYRDLVDIGSDDLVPFIMGSKNQNSDPNITDAQGNLVHKVLPDAAKKSAYEEIRDTGKLPEGYDFLITSYSQLQNGTKEYEVGNDGEIREKDKKNAGASAIEGQLRRDAIASLAKGNIIIMDESHTVGGSGNTGLFMQRILPSCRGATFMSATFAKRADNMPIYALLTDLSESGIKQGELIDAVNKGGVTLQELMSKQLVESGQMIRRERDFTGVTIDWLSTGKDEASDKADQEKFDICAEVFNDIRQFQDDFITPLIEEMSDNAANTGGTVGHKQGTKDMGVNNAPFASKMFNLVNQLLLSMKVDAVVDRALTNLKNGEKPIITFSNTMEGFLEEAPQGVPLDKVPSFSVTLMHALDGVMRWTKKNEKGDIVQTGTIPQSQLPPEGQQKYKEIADKIRDMSVDLPISPMDAIKMRLQQAGYKVGEITGRKLEINATDDGRFIIETRKGRDKKAAARDFNSGDLDVLLINKSGSTGISLHASTKFKDQKPRVMIAAQFQSDINDEVQMRGRNDRTGQVHRGRYEYLVSNIPAEQRLQMMFKQKLKSLDANTTSSQKSKFNEMNIVDFLNKYGDRIAYDYMLEHPDIEERLGDPLGQLLDESKKNNNSRGRDDDSDSNPATDAAAKVCRRLAFLPVADQRRVLNDISAAYQTKIELLNEAGENDLVITTMPLRAKTVRKQIWQKGTNPNSGNAFADNTYLEQCEVDVLKKPMKADEICKMMAKMLDGKSWEDWKQETLAAMRKHFDDYEAETKADMEKKAQLKAQKAHDKYVKDTKKFREQGKNTFTDEEIEHMAQLAAKEKMDSENERIKKRIMTIEGRFTEMRHALSVEPGKVVIVPDMSSNTLGLEGTPAIFVGYNISNDFSASSSTRTYATLDGRRTVRLQLSNHENYNRIINATVMQQSLAESVNLDNWDSKAPTQTRKNAYIVTGNLLKALVDTQKNDKTHGRLIAFSDINGNTRQGILLPDKFEEQDLVVDQPISTQFEGLVKFDLPYVESSDGRVRIESDNWQGFKISVPKSKKTGGEYFLDRTLRNLIGGEFVTRGNKMVGWVKNPADLKKLFTRLSNMGVTVKSKAKLKDVKVPKDQPMDEDTARYRTVSELAGEIDPTVTLEDYYEYTDATFDAVKTVDHSDDSRHPYEKKMLVKAEWEDMKASHPDWEWHRSPKDGSRSEYLIDRENGDVYRYSDHWGVVATCNWKLNGSDVRYETAIGKANISDFRRNNVTAYKYAKAVRIIRLQRAEQFPAMRAEAERLGMKFNVRINVIEDVESITHSVPYIQERRRRSKGWYDTATGGVYIVLPNNRDVEDVRATVFHETVGHKGLRELIGEKGYGDFLREVYEHADRDVRRRIDSLAEKRRWNRDKATDEYLSVLAERDFKDFDDAERSVWQWLKDKVLKAIDMFLGSLRLPEWVKLSDNELRYILWRSKERLVRGKEHPIDLARDIVKREELGLTDGASFNVEKQFTRDDVATDEEEDIIARAKADGSYLKAPNGEPSNLSERQWVQVRTQAFKQWFGDWEKAPESASKVVDENGEPLVVDDLFLHLDNRNPIDKCYKKIERAKALLEKCRQVEKETGYKIKDTRFIYTSSGSSFYDELMSYPDNVMILFEAIYSGAKPKLSVCFRYGGIRDNHRSYNSRDDVYENGVSVVGHVKDLNTDRIGYYEAFFGVSPYNVVIGVENGYRGADGEILLSPAYVVSTADNISNIAKSATVNNGDFSGGDADIRYRHGDGALTDGELSYEHDPVGKMLGRSTRTARQRREFAERERERMADAVAELAQVLHLDNVEVVTDVSQLDGKVAKAKGFFSKRTGKITVVIPNHASVEDAEKTLLHEAVAHYGLRQLFGKQFDTFLDNVFQHADPEIRREMVALAAKRGWDFRTATEEYLAGLAEDTNFEKMPATFWMKIKRLFLDMLHGLGFEGWQGPELGDNELRYLLWRSYENLKEPGRYRSILGEAADVVKQYELKEEEPTSDAAEPSNVTEYRFRDGDKPTTDDLEDVVRGLRDEYDRTIAKGSFQAQEAMQDSMLSLKMLMDIIQKHSGQQKVEDWEDAYTAENALSSRNKAEGDEYNRQYLKPIVEDIHKLMKRGGWTEQDVADHVMIKHGLERNREMAVRRALTDPKTGVMDVARLQEWNQRKADVLNDPTLFTWRAQQEALDNVAESEFDADLYGRDYSGLSSFFDGYDDMQDVVAAAYNDVESFEDRTDTDELQDDIRNATRATLHKLFQSGLIDKATLDNIEQMYQYYVPLRGFDETTAEEVYAYIRNEKSGFTTPLKRANGRTSRADNPFAYIASMANSAIVQGNRNLMKLKFLNFVLNRPSDLVSVSDMWITKNPATGEWETTFPDIPDDATADEVDAIVQQFNEDMQNIVDNEKDLDVADKTVMRIKGKPQVPYRLLHDELSEHQVIVKRGGREYVLTINGNPRAAMALNGKTNPHGDYSGVGGAFKRSAEYINRQLSAFYTTRNPDFVASNFVRDAIYSNSMVWVKERPRYAMKFHRNFAKFNPSHMMRLFHKYNHGRLNMNDPVEKEFYSFMMNGGETGYSNLKELEELKKQLTKDLKNTKLHQMKALLDRLDLINRGVENAARFAAYMTSREEGRSVQKSVFDAKEISVNFNKKGAGGTFFGKTGQTKLGNIAAGTSAACRALYVFFNAGVQGTTNIVRAAKNNKGKFMTMASMYFILGYIAPLLMGGDDGDDDKDHTSYDDLPDYVRRTNLIFKNPAGDSYISLPLPVEFRTLYGMGELCSQVLRGKERYTGPQLARAMGEQVTQGLPINFLEGEGTGMLSPFVPSLAAPLYQAHENKDWTGMPIYHDNGYNQNMPDYTKAFGRTNRHLVDIAEWLNNHTGGDKFEKGTIDLNPAIVESIVQGYFGGAATFVNKMSNTVDMATGQMPFDWRNVPIGNRLIKSGDENTKKRAINREYFTYVDKLGVMNQRESGYKKEIMSPKTDDKEKAEWAAKLDELRNSDQYKDMQEFEALNKQIKKLGELQRKAPDDKELESVIWILKAQANAIARGEWNEDEK